MPTEFDDVGEDELSDFVLEALGKASTKRVCIEKNDNDKFKVIIYP